ncbi:MAG: PilZ domain-containing protein [Planctomycetes bacterium]|nr:PilZ domain-containing protein [Planctomycetota bacterium]
MSWDGVERRGKKRFGVKGASVQHRSAGLLGWMENFSPRYLVLNLSESGLHFITKSDLREGAVLALRLQAPPLEEPIGAKARVVWCRKSQEHNAFRVGMAFLRLSEGERQRLKGVLDNAILDKVDMTTKQFLKEIEKL